MSSTEDYRMRALAIFPHICARCGREFKARLLKELTVHHKNHDHHDNPRDGSNWELLCIYCHDNEHSRLAVADAYESATPTQPKTPQSTHRPFQGLEDLLKRKK